MTRHRLLYVHNSPPAYRPTWIERLFEGAGFDVEVYRACDDALPTRAEGYSGAFLSGSPNGAYEPLPWIEREHRLIEALAGHEVPTLGVCFGSQILASALLGRDQVFRRATCEVGYKWLDTAPAAADDSLACKLGKTFRMFVWHNDEVRAGHPDMRILASSDECPTQVWRYGDLPLWGILGHAEVPRAEAPAWLEERRARLEADGADVTALIAEAEDMATAKTMFHSFLSICERRQP
jgi:GMP synthase-like glutamine amidotransferase